MIVTRLLGGLGNQMFQYAAGLSLAEARRTVLKLDVSWYRNHEEFEAHNRYALDCLNVSAQFATREEVDRLKGFAVTRTERWSAVLASRLRLRRLAESLTSRGTSSGQSSPTSFDAGFGDLPDNSYLEGMWQSPRYFESIAGLLRLHFSFRYPPPPAVAEMAAQINAGPSAALHLRRGDYEKNVTFKRAIGIVDLAYYHEAVRLILRRAPRTTFFIFSDELDVIRRVFTPAAPHVFVDVTEPWHAWDNLRLMSRCDHIAIANSSFSWWAAWLNPSPDKLVIAPDPWFAQPPPGGCDIMPNDWHKLPAR
ncbi:hypothetical protein AYO41_04060 [Verrucomicrobia bacterium SCGC AG-212-E04]|nr:hypothetical protein AYO41_04060 [Verrucomicrobia bacterium SCGC AG-212-E04]